MSNVPQDDLEVGRAALGRLKLIETARGPSVSPLRELLGKRVRVILAMTGGMLLWDQGHVPLWLVLGVVLIVVGVTAPRDRSAERLDALVEFLENTGQLDPNLDQPVRGSA